MEDLVTFLEEEMVRLREKLEKAMLAGEHLFEFKAHFMP